MNGYSQNLSCSFSWKTDKKSTNIELSQLCKPKKEMHEWEQLSWSDIENSANIYSELSDYTHKVIEYILGFLPEPNILIKFEPSLRALSHLHLSGQINFDDYFDQMEEHIKPIRNYYAEPVAVKVHHPEKVKFYHDTFQMHGQVVKNRLIYLLGYEPNLDHSIDVELNMRAQMIDNPAVHAGSVTQFDFMAIGLIKYLEVFHKKGLEAANKSPLVTMYYRDKYQSQITQ